MTSVYSVTSTKSTEEEYQVSPTEVQHRPPVVVEHENNMENNKHI